MSQPGSDAKKNLRTRMRQALKRVDPGLLHSRSVAAAERLVRTDEFRRATTIMMFLSLPGEVDTRAIGLRAWQEQKVVTVPLVGHEQKHMIPVVLRSFDEPMDEDRYGVRTPTTGEPMPIELIDLVVLPGLGFDTLGHRIGRGGGFYDRFLARPEFRGIACGIAMDVQVVEAVPLNGHDRQVDMLVTETRVMRFKHSPV